MVENNSSIITYALGNNVNLGQILIIAAAVITIGASVYKGITSCLPKNLTSHTNFICIDLKKHELIEERQYEFFWGRFGFKKYKFPTFPRNPKIEFFYKPLLKLEDKIPFDKYVVNQKGSHTIIELIDTSFFKEMETEYIKIRATTEINNEEYTQKITVVPQINQIILVNNNDIEIRNFPIDLPQDFDIEKRMKILKYGSLTVLEEYTGTQKEILLVTIPAKEKDTPGRLEIKLD